MELLRESRRAEEELNRQLSEAEERLRQENIKSNQATSQLCAVEQQYQGKQPNGVP